MSFKKKQIYVNFNYAIDVKKVYTSFFILAKCKLMFVRIRYKKYIMDINLSFKKECRIKG